MPMSLDNQPKSPLNMNYLLAALPVRRKRVHRLSESIFAGLVPAARFGQAETR